MDEWYVTRSLIGDHKISYYSLDIHVMSTDSLEDFSTENQDLDYKKYRTIFGHFKPRQKFPDFYQKNIWANVTEINNSCEIMRSYRLGLVYS
uniref:Hexosyltransferase n=1 Tax=Caenorhabditis japonica TaxID=281687 RepID=A0A8R1I0S5_CAEJA